MSVQPSQVDTQPIRKAYGDFSKTLSILNKQVRNYNIKTVLKITLFATAFFASSMLTAFAAFSSFGLSLPLTAFSWKLLAVSSISIGITTLFLITIGKGILKRLKDNRSQFLNKINKDFKKTLKGQTIGTLKALFKKLIHQSSSNGIYLSKAFKKGLFYSVVNVRLDSYQRVEEKYKKTQLAFAQRMRDAIIEASVREQDNSREGSKTRGWLPAFLKR